VAGLTTQEVVDPCSFITRRPAATRLGTRTLRQRPAVPGTLSSPKATGDPIIWGCKGVMGLSDHRPSAVDGDSATAPVEFLAFLDGLQLNWLRDPPIEVRAQWELFADHFFRA
jgi:hypothetical protein